MKNSSLHKLVALAALAGFSCTMLPAFSQWSGNSPFSGGQKVVKTPTGLQYFDITPGNGPMPSAGSTVIVHYTGWLLNKKKFDSSVDRGQPFSFPLGQGRVIKGWDEGVATMKVGGKRRLVIPPALGYGVQGFPPDIPANATLVFDVQLIKFQ
jgi:peptidylprolyl isomerase